MTRALLIAGSLVLQLLITLISLPWVLWAIGKAGLGDDEGFEATMNASPIIRYLDWVERR